MSLCLAPIIGNAQEPAVKPVPEKRTIKIDISKISPAKFDKRAISDYKEQKEFQYDELEVRQLSLWERFWMWFWQMIR